MKINGKNKNGHHLNTNGSNTDQLSKKAVEVLEEVPVKNFNPAQTWLKISAKLSNMDKRFVTWGLAMAASFSLLVAAHLNSFEWQGGHNRESVQLAHAEGWHLLHAARANA